MDSIETPEIATHAPENEDTRHRICAATVDLIGQVGNINHDAVAERAGVSRRTVYRYFPDQTALLRGAREHVGGLIGPKVRFPQSEADLTGQLHDLYTGFDRIAPVSLLMRTTPQGRAIRLADRERRRRAYTAAAADAVKDLPPADQKLATAALQFLHTSAWLEMRDHWGLTGEEMARSIRWAMQTLLNDLRARGGRPLDEDLEP
jgi:AcrR family transcriptional regulator